MKPIRLITLIAILTLTSCDRQNPENGVSESLQSLANLGCIIEFQDDRTYLTIPRGFTKTYLLKTVDNLYSLKSGPIELDLSEIGHMTNLKYLDLRRARIKSFQKLAQLKTLQTLDVSYTNVSNTKFFESLPQLECVSLSGTSIDSLDNLKKCRKLNILMLDYCPNLKSLGQAIEDFPNLEHLFANGLDLSDIERLERLPNLRKLYLDNCKFTKFRVPKNLEWLSLDNCVHLKQLVVSEISSLSVLGIKSTSVRSIAFLENCPKLEVLDISGLTIMNLEYLADCKLWSIGASKFGGSNFIVKRPMPHLKDLYVKNSNIEVIRIEAPNLERIQIKNSKISDAEETKLRKMLPRKCVFDGRN